MPLIEAPPYRPPHLLRNGHVNTIVAGRLRRVPDVAYQRERLDTPDGDFLDLDWAVVDGQPPAGHGRVAVVSHGLEGNTERPYMRGMVRALRRAGWDALAWNFRGCSGTPNRCLRLYHSGATDDLDHVVQHVLARGYEALALIGFSLGGNLTLKYVGEQGADADPRLRAAVAVSVPVDLGAGADVMARPTNRIYMRYFLTALRQKVAHKALHFPGQVSLEGYEQIKTFRAFDDRYTAPLHGFTDAADYYARCSSLAFLPALRRPALLLNAADDPFLAPACYPRDLARQHDFLTLTVPRHGGHVGFAQPGDTYWSEEQAVRFLQAHA